MQIAFTHNFAAALAEATEVSDKLNFKYVVEGVNLYLVAPLPPAPPSFVACYPLVSRDNRVSPVGPPPDTNLLQVYGLGFVALPQYFPQFYPLHYVVNEKNTYLKAHFQNLVAVANLSTCYVQIREL